MDAPLPDAQQPRPDNNTPSIPPAQRPAPPPATVAQAETGIIPAAARGRWTGLADDCKDSSAESALKITADRLEFHESVGTARALEPAEGGYAVQADFTGEGQSWTRRILLRPSADGARLVVVNDGVDVARKRCPA